MRLDFKLLFLTNLLLAKDLYGKESGDVERFVREMEDVFDMVDSRDVQQSSETVDNLRKLWRFFKATESNYIMQAFPRHDGNFESVSKRSAGQKRLNKRGASQYYLLHFGLPGQKGGRRGRFGRRMMLV
ncbi:unnamed protein product [Oikopleura dioica]|uniref:Uncharacterized protein n=1 Tax=Oikopleura dioica TaxID=34765 RepID=E4WTE9_OIKDI|nr:unnamed protein product [Oikopleura dioica]CBY36217.1 unnamed protein product [Oikopleura dioica]